MVTPERRTRADLVAVAVLVVGTLVAWSLLWHFGDARATVSEPASGAPTQLTSPAALPPSFAEVWRAASAATPVPLVAGNPGSTVVTADGREVIGRDPLTGAQRWRYARDIDLCTATAAWGNALTAWSKDPHYCSEVTSINGDTGRRANQRNGDAERDTRVLFDGVHATAIGQRYLETWRSDLVRTTQYGKVPAPVNPGKQPRKGCTYVSVGVAANEIGIVERCPRDGSVPDGDRLTVLKANPKEAEQPEPVYSVPLGIPAAEVVAVSAQRTAVLLAGPNRLAVYDEHGSQVAVYEVDVRLPTADGTTPLVADTTVTAGAVYWFTGDSTIALDPSDFHPLWTVDGTLGSGTIMAGRLLLPTPNELAVLDATTGARIGATPVDRGGYNGPVRMATIGSVVLEQRGPLLVALR